VVSDQEGRLEEWIHDERGWNVEVAWYGSIGSGSSNRSAGADDGDTALRGTPGTHAAGPEAGSFGSGVSSGEPEELYGDVADCGRGERLFEVDLGL
jgi:hypothetical protein